MINANIDIKKEKIKERKKRNGMVIPIAFSIFCKDVDDVHL